MQPKQMPNFDISGLKLVPKEEVKPKSVMDNYRDAKESGDQNAIKEAGKAASEMYDLKVTTSQNIAELPNKELKKVETLKVSEVPVQEPKLKSTILKPVSEVSKEEVERRSYVTEVRGQANSLDKKAESFEKLSKSFLVGSALSAIAGVVTWVGAGSVAGGTALLPILAPVAVPIVGGAIVIGGVSFAGALILKILKNRAYNKKNNLVNDNRGINW